jgi:hypothetical protein
VRVLVWVRMWVWVRVRVRVRVGVGVRVRVRARARVRVRGRVRRATAAWRIFVEHNECGARAKPPRTHTYSAFARRTTACCGSG